MYLLAKEMMNFDTFYRKMEHIMKTRYSKKLTACDTSLNCFQNNINLVAFPTRTFNAFRSMMLKYKMTEY